MPGFFSLKAEDLLEKEFVSVESDESLSKAISRMDSAEEDTALVFSGKKYLGTVRLYDLLRKGGNPSRLKAKNFVSHSPKISGKDGVERIIEMMVESGDRVLPVVDEKAGVEGVVKAKAVLEKGI